MHVFAQFPQVLISIEIELIVCMYYIKFMYIFWCVQEASCCDSHLYTVTYMHVCFPICIVCFQWLMCDESVSYRTGFGLRHTLSWRIHALVLRKRTLRRYSCVGALGSNIGNTECSFIILLCCLWARRLVDRWPFQSNVASLFPWVFLVWKCSVVLVGKFCLWEV